MFKKILFMMMFIISIPAFAQDKMTLLYVGHDTGNGTPLSKWNVTTINQLSHSNGFLILPISNNMAGYASFNRYQSYLNDVAEVVIAIKSARTDRGLPANVWLSTPQGKVKGMSLADLPGSNVTDTFMSQLRSKVVAATGYSFWSNNVKGIYLFDEILDVYTSIPQPEQQQADYVSAVKSSIEKVYNLNTTDLSNPYRKGLIWSPYWGMENAKLTHNISIWLSYSNTRYNNYPLFDGIFIQSNLIFKAGKTVSTCEQENEKRKEQDQIDCAAAATYKQQLTDWSFEHIRHWAANQHINGVYPKVFPYGHKTKVGVNIEINNGFKHGETQLKRDETKAFYKMGVDEYDWLVKNGRDFIFFVSSKNQLDDNNTPEIKTCINNFYNPSFEVVAGPVAKCMEGF
jgi:hypothetical protein